jgi:hypothetical protein
MEWKVVPTLSSVACPLILRFSTVIHPTGVDMVRMKEGVLVVVVSTKQ